MTDLKTVTPRWGAFIIYNLLALLDFLGVQEPTQYSHFYKNRSMAIRFSKYFIIIQIMNRIVNWQVAKLVKHATPSKPFWHRDFVFKHYTSTVSRNTIFI
jgi:hypothetical protein